MQKIILHDNIYIIDDFLTVDECSDLIEIAKKHKDTLIYDENWLYNEDWKLPNPAYKSTIHKGQHKLVSNIEERLASTVDMPIENQENFLACRSDPNTRGFPPHLDSFNITSSYYEKETQKSGNRILTALFYLSDVEEAGETYFTHFESKIKPKIGRLLVYKNIIKGKINPKTIHASLPVKKGIKWIFIKFIREYKFS